MIQNHPKGIYIHVFVELEASVKVLWGQILGRPTLVSFDDSLLGFRVYHLLSNDISLKLLLQVEKRLYEYFAEPVIDC